MEFIRGPLDIKEFLRFRIMKELYENNVEKQVNLVRHFLENIKIKEKFDSWKANESRLVDHVTEEWSLNLVLAKLVLYSVVEFLYIIS